MLLQFSLLLTLLCFCFAQEEFSKCGQSSRAAVTRSPAEIATRIAAAIDTSSDPIGTWPWMASLGYVQDSEWKHLCGSVIITQQFVLTAAHCVLGSGRLFLRLGDKDLNSPIDDFGANTREVDQVTIHPKYNENAYPKINYICGLILITGSLQMSLVLGPGSSDGSELLNIVQQIVELLPGAKDVSFEGADGEILATGAQYHCYKDLADKIQEFLSTPIKGITRVKIKLVALIIAGAFVYLTGIALLFLAPSAGAAVIASGFILQGTIIGYTGLAVGAAMTLSRFPLQKMLLRNYDTFTMREVSSYTEFITIICRSLQRQVQKSRVAELLQSSSIVDLEKALCILWEATKASNRSKDPKRHIFLIIVMYGICQVLYAVRRYSRMHTR